MKKLFVKICLLMICNVVFAQNDFNCKLYRTGFFEYEGKYSNVIIFRNEYYQIEYSLKSDEWVVIKLDWINDCKYTFSYIDTNTEKLKPYIGHTMHVEIISGDTKGYAYHSVHKEDNKEFDGRLLFLTTNINKLEKKKIMKKLEDFHE